MKPTAQVRLASCLFIALATLPAVAGVTVNVRQGTLCCRVRVGTESNGENAACRFLGLGTTTRNQSLTKGDFTATSNGSVTLGFDRDTPGRLNLTLEVDLETTVTEGGIEGSISSTGDVLLEFDVVVSDQPALFLGTSVSAFNDEFSTAFEQDDGSECENISAPEGPCLIGLTNSFETLQPGTYRVTLRIGTHAGPSSGLGGDIVRSRMHRKYVASFLDEDEKSETLEWKDADGGDYIDEESWEPASVPRHNENQSDTAKFALAGPGGAALPIAMQDATAGKWIISGAIDVNGSARLLGASPALSMNQNGTLLLDDGATLESTTAQIGLNVNTASTGPRITVSGSGSKWKTTVEAAIADSKGSLAKIEDGGQVEAHFFTVGRSTGLSGTVEVRGPVGVGVTPSTLKVIDTLRIGTGPEGSTGGTGSLLIEQGGKVIASELRVGDLADNGGEKVTVSGLNGPQQRSTLNVNVQSFVVVGDEGTQIEVKDGGAMTTKGAFIGSVGDVIGVGSVIVRNTNSSLLPFNPDTGEGGAFWRATDSIFVGGNEGSRILVEGGGVLIAPDILLGDIEGLQGKLEVTDTGSLARISGALTVGGEGGPGTLDIGGGGRVESGPSSVGGTTGEGSVLIRGLASPAEWSVTGNLDVGNAGAAGSILLDSPTGIPLIGGLFGGATVRATGFLTVGARGSITGRGTLAVPLPNRTIVDGGVIAPGLSPGRITIDGDLELREGSKLVMEIGGLEEGQFDVLHVTGNATLAGKVELHLINGFVPQAGDAVEFLQVDGERTGQVVVEIAPPTDGLPSPLAGATLEPGEDGRLRLVMTPVEEPDPADNSNSNANDNVAQPGDDNANDNSAGNDNGASNDDEESPAGGIDPCTPVGASAAPLLATLAFVARRRARNRARP